MRQKFLSHGSDLLGNGGGKPSCKQLQENGAYRELLWNRRRIAMASHAFVLRRLSHRAIVEPQKSNGFSVDISGKLQMQNLT